MSLLPSPPRPGWPAAGGAAPLAPPRLAPPPRAGRAVLDRPLAPGLVIRQAQPSRDPARLSPVALAPGFNQADQVGGRLRERLFQRGLPCLAVRAIAPPHIPRDNADRRLHHRAIRGVRIKGHPASMQCQRARRMAALGILEALIPGRMQGHSGTAEVRGGRLADIDPRQLTANPGERVARVTPRPVPRPHLRRSGQQPPGPWRRPAGTWRSRCRSAPTSRTATGPGLRGQAHAAPRRPAPATTWPG